jgi:hypothetical protein
VRAPPFCSEGRALVLRQLQAAAVVDRRQAERELALALAVELVLGLVAGVEPPAALQLLGKRRIALQARRLALLQRPRKPEPPHILANAFGEGFRRPLDVGVIEAQHESTALRFREQPVEERRPHVADVQTTGGARREANRDRHRWASGCRR